MPKPICLITGATDGIGKATATALALKGFTVVLLARNPVKAAAVKEEIARATGAADVDHVIADFGSLRQVQAAAQTFKQKYSHLDVLINNAGIFAPKRVISKDGYELTYQVNYLSHFLLTQSLLDRLKDGKRSRIINLSSNVYNIGKFAPDNLQSEKHFSPIGAYAASKLFMLMFTLELAERLSGAGITANAAHPGIVRTPMLAGATGLFKLISYLAMPFSVSPERGASTSVHLASSAEAESISGQYVVNSKPQPIKTKFNTRENRKRLWDLGMESLQRVAP